ncbi:helix-turn-helix transcriptional regulator [Mesorhizobium silamurunense]|uniref:helix-turn-helix transcriptional regulator n=1 Tax=Mesorhizobium silamurunense TaxID=499528 RepID=UPI0017859C1C|nr:AraC family transcriptional regulator [Mesorhizobium silamurunense]
MNIAYLSPGELRGKQDAGFENHAPTATRHFWAFVHGAIDVPYHWHREMEILLVLRGRFRLVVDGQLCEMNPDDVIIINSDVPHNSTSVSPDALICGVHLDGAYFERLGLPGFSSRHYLCRTFLHGRSFMNRTAPMKALMARLVLDQTGHLEEMMVRDTTANLLACFIYRAIPYQESEGGEAPLRSASRNRILKIMDAVGGQDDNRTLSEIADAEGLTLSHLSRLFKRHLGIGYRDYCLNQRLDAAAHELRITDHTISMIMERNSFGNPAVFYNKFRARFGCSPGEFRRGQGLRGARSKLTEEDASEALRLLTQHAVQIGKAAEISLGVNATGRREVTLRAPYNAGSR